MNLHVEDNTMYLDGYNLQTSNFYTSNIYTSNVYTSNIYTENSISTDIYNSNILTTNITSKLIQSCNIIPYINSNCDLGEHVNKWNNLYTYNMFGTHYVDSDERDYHETDYGTITNPITPSDTSSALKRVKSIPIYQYKKKWDLEDTFENNSNNMTSSNIGIKASDLKKIIPNAITERTSYIPNLKKYVNTKLEKEPNLYTLKLNSGTWDDIFDVIDIDINLKKQILLINPNGNRYFVEASNIPTSSSFDAANLYVYSSNNIPPSGNKYMVYGTLTSNYMSINYHEILNNIIMAFQEMP